MVLRKVVEEWTAQRDGAVSRHLAPITRATPMEDLPEFLSPEEFRTYMGIGRATCYDLLRRGEIPSVRFGRAIRVPKSVLLVQDERE